MRKPFDGDYQLTQGFGVNPDAYAKFGLKGHDGLDYGLPSGTRVNAPHNGKVLEAASDPQGYGNYLKIENDQEGSVLAHLKSFAVAVGDTVSEGQYVGLSNNTGNSTGPHLHWGYYRKPRDRSNGYAGFIDQSPYLVVSPPEPMPVMTEMQKITQHDATLKTAQDVLDRFTFYDGVISRKDEQIGQLQRANDTLVTKINGLTTANDELNKELADCRANCQQPADSKYQSLVSAIAEIITKILKLQVISDVRDQLRRSGKS